MHKEKSTVRATRKSHCSSAYFWRARRNPANLAAAAIPCSQRLGHNVRMSIYRLVLLALLFVCNPLVAAESDLVLDTAERHARLQTQGLPGKVSIRVGRLDVSKLPPCSAHEAYTPQGARMLGKTTVGVRCLGPNIWNVRVSIEISVTGN